MDLGTNKLGITMVPGFYEDAERASFASPGHPGLDVSFDHRGCNQVAGAFRVYSAVVSNAPSNNVRHFSASFEQNCEISNPTLKGWFVFYGSGVTPFTDDPLVPSVTPLRELHIQELRERTNVVRLKCGVNAFAFRDPVLEAGVTVARAVHIVEVRTALDEAYAACGMAVPVYANEIQSGGVTVIRADDVADLSGAIIGLELSAALGVIP